MSCERQMTLLLTRVTTSTDFILSHKLNVNKVNLELLLGLSADKKRQPTPSGNNFVGETSAFENEHELTLELQQNSLDKGWECDALVRLGVIDELFEHRHGLRIGLALELVAMHMEDEPELS